MMDDLRDIAAFFGIVSAIVFIVGLFISGVYSVVDSHGCNAVGTRMGIPHEWGFWEGCMIEPVPGKWIELDRYHGVREEK
jgi:hypothetical protein